MGVNCKLTVFVCVECFISLWRLEISCCQLMDSHWWELTTMEQWRFYVRQDILLFLWSPEKSHVLCPYLMLRFIFFLFTCYFDLQVLIRKLLIENLLVSKFHFKCSCYKRRQFTVYLFCSLVFFPSYQFTQIIFVYD